MENKLFDDPQSALIAGRTLAHPEPGDEVVISGISGAFPDSDNVAVFSQKLFEKVDLVTDDDRRWKLNHPEIPQRTGKLHNINKFDAAFFGVHHKQAQTMDPMCRILLEKAYEAVVDSGYNPRSIYGSRTGVFIGACFSESEKTCFYEKLQVNGFGVTGCCRAMLANRISFYLGLNGPSYTIDSACSSSLYAMEQGYRAIRDGQCDAALIGGSNLCLHPYVSLQFARLGVLSMDGRCKSFDVRADGYCRSEAVSVVFLQKAKDAHRIYATVIHAKTNCDGYKEQGITFPSGPLQQVLLQDFYNECEIDPSTLAWVEAHGTGTKVGDPEEVGAIENVFCKNRKEVLKIGSVKSNIGHTEPASGLCSIVKVLIAMETGLIPPNINYEIPRTDIKAFENGAIQVIADTTPWNGGLVGVNSFGFGGANCHVLLRWNEKKKINGGAPLDNLPRLINVSGRTVEAVNNILNYLENTPLDVEYVKLLHDIHKDEIPGHHYRGFVVMNRSSQRLSRDVQYYSGLEREVWYVYSGLGSEWPGMGKNLLSFPAFASAIDQCDQALRPFNIDLRKILTDEKVSFSSNPIHALIGITAIQIGLTDLLRKLGHTPNGYIGVSIGDLAAAYADGCLTSEQAILSAYYIALALTQSRPITSSTVEIALKNADIKDICPRDINVVSSSPKTTTICGPKASVDAFVSTLKGNVEVVEINTSSIPYHSAYISHAAPTLNNYLSKVISQPRTRSKRWLSSAPGATASPEFFLNNILKPVNITELLSQIQSNVVLVEVSPHGVCHQALSRGLKKATHISILNRGTNSLLPSLGRLYETGINLDIAQLYPAVSYPVSRATPMISPLIKWDHAEDWYVTSYRMQEKIKSGERTVSISLKNDDLEYISGHIIDGRNLFPATGYLVLAWETVALMRGELHTEVPVVFENVRFHRATNISKDGSIDFVVMIQKGSGSFEIVEGGAAIVTGRVYVPRDVENEQSGLPPLSVTQQDEDTIELTARDIYKELRLRGYNYKGLFRGLVSADNTGSVGKLEWQNNWVAFMDNMLQIMILQEDTRGLFVPTSIQRVVIDVRKHHKLVSELTEEVKVLPINSYKEVELIRSGGVEIRGLKVSAISRRKPLGEPVLETQEFVALTSNNETLPLPHVLRAFVQVALENEETEKVKMAEIVDGETNPNSHLLAPIIGSILGDLPLIQAEICVISRPDHPLVVDVPNEVTVEDKKIPNDQSLHFVTASDLFNDSRSEVLSNCLAALKEGGFLISREKLHSKINHQGLVLFSSHVSGDEAVVLLRKASLNTVQPEVIKVSDKDLSWIRTLQAAIASNDISNILLVSEKDCYSGLMGLTKCLRREVGGHKVRCLLIMDPKAPRFSLDEPLYATQIKKNMGYNVYKDGTWGTFRHIPLEHDRDVECLQTFVNVTTRGDLSSLKWIQGHVNDLNMPLGPNETFVYEFYGALNFRDIMTATAKIAPELVCPGRLYQECVQGLEFSGITTEGKRVMGMCNSKGVSSLLLADKHLLWDVPEEWSLEDAVTIPIVYGTAIYSLLMSGKMTKGETVLIHAGSGGVGLASIQLALHYGCTVFTTVGTQEKREFVKQQFPQLTDSHIGNSRDCSFEQMVMKETQGRGVDIVLNSLAEEKLLASVRCLAIGGRFLEIGKFDLGNNNPLGLEVFLRQASFHGIMLDKVFHGTDQFRKSLHRELQREIDQGAVKPLTRKVFQNDQIEQAFRYMAAGKHIGKVLIKVRDEAASIDLSKPQHLMRLGKSRFYCSKSKTYIIAGGLGGFGLELADWLVLRGARKLILVSRKGLQNGYQSLRIRLWRSYGTQVQISTQDIQSPEGVVKLLKEANALGPVGGIFNLAVVLRDALFENQTEEQFRASISPKATATHLLDKYSRVMCPELDQFVIFSSVSCGRGNPGQTNYGMANSIMERICEVRAAEGLPGLAIQWGCVGDVGLVAEMREDDIEIVIGGTLQQQITSCLQVLDDFMTQKYPVVSSMVVAEKRAGSGSSDNIVDSIANIMGLRDLKTVSLHSTLAELGMDSMMAVEIKQTLEREFEVFLTPQEIRGITFAKLHEISSSKEAIISSGSAATGEELSTFGINYLVRVVGEEEAARHKKVRLPSLYKSGSVSDSTASESQMVYFIPGIEGVAQIFETLASNLQYPVTCLQYDYNIPFDSVEALADSLIQQIKPNLKPEETFNILGYSFGGSVAVAVVHKLEQMGYTGNLILVDGTPNFISQIAALSMGESDEIIQRRVILQMLDILWPQHKEKIDVLIRDLPWEAKMDVVVNTMPAKKKYSEQYQKLSMNAVYHRIRASIKYTGPPEQSIASPVLLLRPTEIIVSSPAEDYGFSKYCKRSVSVHFLDGSHISILDNPGTAEMINTFLDAQKGEKVVYKKPFIQPPQEISRDSGIKQI